MSRNNLSILKRPVRYSYNNKSLVRYYTTKTNIFDVSPGILCKIISYIFHTNDYINLRITCKTFYNLMENIHKYDYLGNISKIIYFKNNISYKIETFSLKRGINLSLKTYLSSIVFLKDNKKSGTQIYYNNNRTVKSKYMWKNGRLDGTCIELTDNKLVKKTDYLEGLKHGNRYIIVPNNNIMIVSDWNKGLKEKVKKFVKNNLVLHANFKNRVLHGETVVYYNELFRKGDIKNILSFNNGNLDGVSLINEYDRVLKLTFKNGVLHGIQSIFTTEHKLKCIIEYVDGKLWGRYAFFNNFKKVEEGYNYNGFYDKSITVYNPVELSKNIYPIKNNVVEGEVIERINFVEIKLLYTNNKFAGRYIMSDISSGETTEINFYNHNNFDYKKYYFGKELIILKKRFGEYTLVTYNLDDESINNLPLEKRRVKADLVNHYKY